jgi:hypothetical protein
MSENGRKLQRKFLKQEGVPSPDRAATGTITITYSRKVIRLNFSIKTMLYCRNIRNIGIFEHSQNLIKKKGTGFIIRAGLEASAF